MATFELYDVLTLSLVLFLTIERLWHIYKKEDKNVRSNLP